MNAVTLISHHTRPGRDSQRLTPRNPLLLVGLENRLDRPGIRAFGEMRATNRLRMPKRPLRLCFAYTNHTMKQTREIQVVQGAVIRGKTESSGADRTTSREQMRRMPKAVEVRSTEAHKEGRND